MSTKPNINLSIADSRDLPELARMNHALIRDEGSANPMNLAELEARMRAFLAGEYKCAVIRMDESEAGYCLWRPEEEPHGGPAGIYLRQYYIKPEYRRQGLGRSAMKQIFNEYFAGAAFVSLDVLEHNERGRAFWKDYGFEAEYIHMKLKL